MKKKIFVLGIFLSVLFLGTVFAKEVMPEDAKKIVQKAEDFVRDNGYTDLKSKPYAISKGTGYSKAGWTVLFQYKNGDSNRTRVVTMDEKGENIKMGDHDFLLKGAEKKTNG